MTREEAQELLATAGGKLAMEKLQAVNFIFNELDELKMMEEDAQQYALKCRKELEALQSRSCATCEYYGTFRYTGKDSRCTRCCNFFSNRYEQKEQ